RGERIEVDSHIATVRSLFAKMAGRSQPVIAVSNIRKFHFLQRSRKEVAGRIATGIAADDGVPRHHRARKVAFQARESASRAGTNETVLLVLHDVIAKDEARVRRAIAHHKAFGLESGVMFDDHIGRSGEQLKQSSPSPPAPHILEEIISDEDVLCLAAGVDVVSSKDVHAGGNMTDDVVREGHIFDSRPWRIAILVPNGEEDGKPVLRLWPVVFEQVAVDHYVAGALEFEQVLHAPWRAGVGRIAHSPGG